MPKPSTSNYIAILTHQAGEDSFPVRSSNTRTATDHAFTYARKVLKVRGDFSLRVLG